VFARAQYISVGQEPEASLSLRFLLEALEAVERDYGTADLETARVCFNIGLVMRSRLGHGGLLEPAAARAEVGAPRAAGCATDAGVGRVL
jgi:hypothetical protein